MKKQKRFVFGMSISTRAVTVEGTVTAYGVDAKQAEENARAALRREDWVVFTFDPEPEQ